MEFLDLSNAGIRKDTETFELKWTIEECVYYLSTVFQCTFQCRRSLCAFYMK